MSTRTNIAVLALLTSAVFSGAAHAAQISPTAPATSKTMIVAANTEKRPAHHFKMMETAKVGAWKEGNIDIETISEQVKDMRAELNAVSPAELSKIQDELKANPALVAELKKRNVEINNIVGLEEFSDGGVSVYVR